MTLHTPVRPLQFYQDRPLASYGWLAPVVVLGWLLWHPQRLAQYEAEGIRKQKLRRLPARLSWRAWWGWFNYSPRQGDVLLVCAGSLALQTIIVYTLCWVVASNAADSRGGGSLFWLLIDMVLMILLSEIVFMSSLLLLSQRQVTLLTPIGSALVTTMFVSIVTATIWAGLGIIQNPESTIHHVSPIWYGMFVALVFGIWFGVAYAYFDFFEFQSRTLLLESGLAGIAIGSLTTSILLTFGSVTPTPSETDMLAIMISSILVASFAFALGVLRPDQWLVTIIAGRKFKITQDATGIIPCISPIPSKRLFEILNDWLDADPWVGLQNTWDVWDNTRQKATVRNAIQGRLSREQDAEAMARAVNLIIEQRIKSRQRMTTADWSIIFGKTLDRPPLGYFKLPSLRLGRNKTADEPAKRRQEKRLKQWAKIGVVRHPPRSLPSVETHQGVAAVFWYLQYGYIGEAVRSLKGLPTGGPTLQELRRIATALEMLWNVEGISRTAKLVLPAPPQQPLWPGTWIAIDELSEACQLSWIFLRTNDLTQREWCIRRATEIVRTVRLKASARPTTPKPGTAYLGERTGLVEANFIRRLTLDWGDALQAWGRSPAIPSLRQAVPSPFNVTQPISSSQTKALVGRDIEVAQLVATWTSGTLASTLLFGQPLIGKSSIINAAIQAVRGRAVVIRITLDHESRVHPPATVLLISICERICAEAGVPMPGIDAPIWLQDPYEQFQISFTESLRQIDNKPTIIVVDSIDVLENSAMVPDVLNECLRYLLQLSMRYPQVVFTFVTRLPRVYWNRTPNHPLVRQCRYLEIGALNTSSLVQSQQARQIGLVHEIVNIPLRSANLRFHDDALQRIFNIMEGHPYLIVAIAHAVIADYNNRVETTTPSFLLMTSDVQAVLRQPFFLAFLRRFGETMIGVLEQMFPHGRRDFVSDVLREIAGMPTPILLSQLDARFPPTVAGNPRQDELYFLLACMEELNLISVMPGVGNWQFSRQTQLLWAWIPTR